MMESIGVFIHPFFWSPMTEFSRTKPLSRTLPDLTLIPDGPGGRPLVGLSTDLYFPPLEDLLSLLSGSLPEYIELFRGRTIDLSRARSFVPSRLPLMYHGDCLWYTQPDFPFSPAYREEIRRANLHMDALGSPWMIHECAQKTIEGYAFGLYAPPLLSREGAIVARNGALSLQEALEGRLLLVETPPFPPHPVGEMDLGEFFHIMTRETGLGIGLDIGHCLTYLEASGGKAEPGSLIDWLGGFPLERVVEIHVGGLFRRLAARGSFLFDDHSREIPDLLFESLEGVLRSHSMPGLRGVALEVDNKEPNLIAGEFARFREVVERIFESDLSPRAPRVSARENPEVPSPFVWTREEGPREDDLLGRVREGYRSLARDLAENPRSSYTRTLYPEEIWQFGGAMPDLFPETLALLEQEGIPVRESFIDFFNRSPQSETTSYDYLKIKIRRTLDWVEFLTGSSPGVLKGEFVLSVARREALLLDAAQEQFNGDPV